MSGEKPSAYIERGPWKTQRLGGLSLRSAIEADRYVLTDEDAEYMAYEGYPNVQADPSDTTDSQSQLPENPHDGKSVAAHNGSPTCQLPTRYVVARTPLERRQELTTETLTTKAL